MPDPTPNSGAGGEGGTPPAATPSAGARGADPSRSDDRGAREGNSRRSAAREYIAEAGGATRAVMRLLRENFQLRDTRREVPKDAVVLAGEDAKAFQAFQALNLKLEQITAGLSERDTLKAWKATRERDDQIDKIAKDVGYNGAVLRTVLREQLDAGAKLELRPVTVEKNGKQETTQVPHLVTGTGDTAKAEPLTVVVERDHKDFLPSLKADGSAARGGTSSTTSGSGSGSAAQGATSSSSSTTRFVATRDTPAKGTASDDPVARIETRYSRPSQLREAREKRLGRAPAA